MKSKLQLVAVVGILCGIVSPAVLVQERPALQSDKDKLSYALGMDLGNQLGGTQIELVAIN